MINELLSQIAVSRRQFLQQIGLTLGAAAFLSPAEVLGGDANLVTPQHVVIVGAGIAGLCAAYELEQRGHQVSPFWKRTPSMSGAGCGLGAIPTGITANWGRCAFPPCII